MITPEPLDGEEIFTYTEAKQKAREDEKFEALTCHVWVNGYGWYNIDSATWTYLDIRPPMGMTVKTATTTFGEMAFVYVEITPPDPSKPRRRCRIANTLSAEVISLIKLSPNNATFRARVMAEIGELPPKDADTYDKIKDWIEFTFPKQGTNNVAAKPSAPPPPTLNLRYTAREEIRGRCRFTATEHITGTVTVRETTIRGIIDNCSDMDEVFNEFRDKIYEIAREEGSRERVDEETSDHDNQDSDGVEDLDYSLASARDFIMRIAREYVDREEWENYGIE